MLKLKSTIHLAIFASGAGSNAKKIIEYFKDNDLITISLIVSNKANAGVLNIAQQENIPTLVINKEQFAKGDGYIPELKEKKIDWIILAGFLWKIPQSLIDVFPSKIINIHPALLPKYGGKGMYGHFVHEAVVENKESESGITIHIVDEHYDHGDTIFQATCVVNHNDTPEMVAHKVQKLEHLHYPQVIESVVLNKK